MASAKSHQVRTLRKEESNFNPETERIDLLRGGEVVSSLAGAFGSALRETRLTAMLGYLVALEPDRFCDFFGFQGRPQSVSLETRHSADRSDISIETTVGRGIIEAKTSATDPFLQSMKYPAKWRVLLTEHAASGYQTGMKGVKYLRWRDLAGLLQNMAKSNSSAVRFVSRDLINYLEEHSMIKRQESVEIYAREINNEVTLALFLRAQMYCCDYQKGSRLAEALYFAPHFGQRIAQDHPGVKVGVSYVARVDRVEVVETWKDFLQMARKVKGKPWFNSHFPFLRPIRSWPWRNVKRNILFLNMPRLVFNPPVLKANLVKGHGWLAKRFFSFDTLFTAWGAIAVDNK